MQALYYLAHVCGWLYFIGFATCMYPQLYMNYKRKSVVGFSFDWAWLNCHGYVWLSGFYLVMCFDADVGEQYVEKYGREQPVELFDVFYAVHGALLCILELFQCYLMGYEDGGQSVSRWTVRLLFTMWLFVVFSAAAWMSGYMLALQWVTILGYMKTVMTTIKRMPQLVMNCRRRSTDGFSAGYMLLDFGGCVFLLSQMVLSSLAQGSFHQLRGNLPKFILGVEGAVVNGVFLIQHFIVYRGHQRYNVLEEESVAGSLGDADVADVDGGVELVVVENASASGGSRGNVED